MFHCNSMFQKPMLTSNDFLTEFDKLEYDTNGKYNIII